MPKPLYHYTVMVRPNSGATEQQIKSATFSILAGKDRGNSQKAWFATVEDNKHSKLWRAWGSTAQSEYQIQPQDAYVLLLDFGEKAESEQLTKAQVLEMVRAAVDAHYIDAHTKPILFNTDEQIQQVLRSQDLLPSVEDFAAEMIRSGMMINHLGICFHFENAEIDIYSGRAIDLDVWRLPMLAMGLNDMAIINKADARISMLTDEKVNREEYMTFAQFQDAHPEDEFYYLVTPKEVGEWYLQVQDVKTVIDAIDPTKKTWFCFGPAMGWSDEIDKTQMSRMITINQLDPNIELHSFQSGLVMLGVIANHIYDARREAQ